MKIKLELWQLCLLSKTVRKPTYSIQEAETRKGAVLSDPGLACKYNCHDSTSALLLLLPVLRVNLLTDPHTLLIKPTASEL